MALTLEVEQRLLDVGLVQMYLAAPKPWNQAAKASYGFVQKNFPAGAAIRRDDIAKALVPILEVNEALKTFLATHKLTQKYWIRDFADLIIDRIWNAIHEA